MKYRVIFAVVAMQASLFAQTPHEEKRATVGKVCGQVVSFENWGDPPFSSWQRAPIKKADVLLYNRIAKKKCCSPDQLIAQTSTDGGGFEFKDTAPGEYWVVVVVGKKKHKLGVTLTAYEKDKGDCSLLYYEVVNGHQLRLIRMVRLE